MYLREAARLAEQAGDSRQWGNALLKLSDVLAVDDPVAAAGAARTAVDHLRRVGYRDALAFATGNLVVALTSTGEWDAAAETLGNAVENDGLLDPTDDGGRYLGTLVLAVYRAWLGALRGDVEVAHGLMAGVAELRESDTAQDSAFVAFGDAFAAAAGGHQAAALAHARGALDLAHHLPLSTESLRWIWPLAARSADELGDMAVTIELLAILDSHQPGELPAMLRAERDLVRARLAAGNDDADSQPLFANAVGGLRTMSTPYHLAHGLLDQAEFLLRVGEPAAADGAVDEARRIAERLGCPPLLERADRISPGIAAPAEQRSGRVSPR